MIERLMRRLLDRASPDLQTRRLLGNGARGLRNGALGLLTASDRWAASLRRRNHRAVEQPADCPLVDLAVGDPIAAITADPGFPRFADFFAAPKHDAPALISAHSQALIYALVRNLQPEHVIEIGTYRGSTSQAICRALHANGSGFLHTVDPNDGGAIVKLIRRWPYDLRRRLCYYPTSSMEFFTIAAYHSVTADLVFVDGNHDYEYALFDVLSAARLLRPGGFIVIDNISQGGPIYAARDFMRDRPGWREYGHALVSPPKGRAFDLQRSTIPETDLCVIRAPSGLTLGPRFETSGVQPMMREQVSGIQLNIARPASGVLFAQYIVRIDHPQPTETMIETNIGLHDATGAMRLALPWRFEPDEIPLKRSIELWLGWTGEKALELSERPVFY